MSEIDFQSLMDSMGNPMEQGDPIKSIYGIIPHMDNTQMHLKFQVEYFIEKYNLTEWRAVMDNMEKQLMTNKSLGFLSSQSLKSMLNAYTQNELIRGIKVSAMNNTSENK